MSGAASPVPSLNMSKISEDAHSVAGSHVTFSEDVLEEDIEDPEDPEDSEKNIETAEPEQYQSAEESAFEADYEDTTSQATEMDKQLDILAEDLNLSFDSTHMDQDWIESVKVTTLSYRYLTWAA